MVIARVISQRSWAMWPRGPAPMRLALATFAAAQRTQCWLQDDCVIHLPDNSDEEDDAAPQFLREGEFAAVFLAFIGWPSILIFWHIFEIKLTAMQHDSQDVLAVLRNTAQRRPTKIRNANRFLFHLVGYPLLTAEISSRASGHTHCISAQSVDKAKNCP